MSYLCKTNQEKSWDVLWKIKLSVQEKFRQILWRVIEMDFSSWNDKDIGPCIVHKINYESRIKWVGSVTDLRFENPKGDLNSSTQAGYRLILSTEGNAVGKLIKWFGDVGRPIEVGTPIGITRRNIAKNEVIRFHYCVFQYKRGLKTERYVRVRVVPLLTLINFYQGVDLEVILKYGNGDISRSSWVFRCSKDSEARDGPLLLQSTTQKLMEVDIFQYETTEAKVSVR
jgi:hypothetical protein